MIIYSAGSEFLIFNLISFIIFLIIYVSINVKKIKSIPKYVPKYKEPKVASSPNPVIKGMSEALKLFLNILYEYQVIEANIANLLIVRAAYKRLVFFGSKVFEIDRRIGDGRSKLTELKKKLEANKYDLSRMSALADANSSVLFNQACNIIFNSMTQEEKLLATFIKGTDTFVKRNDSITFYTEFLYVTYNISSGNLYLMVYEFECEKKLDWEQCAYPSSNDEIAATTWLHARNDGGPDRRFSTNYKIYYVYRGKLIGKFGNKSYYLHYNNKSSTEADEVKIDNFVKCYNGLK